MPPLYYCDDFVFFANTPIDKIRFLASLYAILVNDLEGSIVDETVTFIPINATPYQLTQFIISYNQAYQFLAPLFFA